MNSNIKFKNNLINILKNEKRIWNGLEIDQIQLLRLLEKYDDKIISLLFQDEKLKNEFFLKIDNIYIFKYEDFKFYIEEHKPLDNSYTELKNRIGLGIRKKFIKDSNDIVLNFPFKDCILEGGQTSEEGFDKYYEYFEKNLKEEELNKVPELIGKIEEVHVNTRKKNSYNIKGYQQKESKRKEIFFNEILAKDEVDRLLDYKAFVNWKKYDKYGEHKITELRRNENGKIKENLIIKGNNLLVLHSLKKEFSAKVNMIYIDPPFNTGNDTFSYNDKFSRSTWLTFMKNRLEIARELLTEDGNIFIHLDINHSHYLKVLCDEIFGEKNFVEEIIWAYGSPSGGRAAGAKPVNIHDYILHYAKNYSQRKQKKTYVPYSDKYIKDWFKYKDDDGRLYQKRQRKNSEGETVWQKQYLDTSVGVPLSTVWTDIKQVYADPRAYKENQKQYTELEKEFSGGQKPEALIKRILEMCTDEGDLILDYHLGTGTTAVAAHKMKRQYIGIEQLDYIDKFIVKRLRNSILGDLKGISKEVNWIDGGDFIYTELAKNNELAKEKILNCENDTDLCKLLEELYEKYFLNYNFRLKEFKEKIIKDSKFTSLKLEDKKIIFLEMLDLNQMYINRDDMEDSRYKIDKNDIALTNMFYRGSDI